VRLKNKFILLSVLASLVMAASWLLSRSEFIPWYDRFIYYPFQSVRGAVLSYIPFSVGDVLYALAGLGILITVARWIYFAAKLGERRRRLFGSMLNTVNVAMAVYLFFLLGWGANYYKKPLREYWRLNEDASLVHKFSLKDSRLSTEDLIAFDTILIKRLNDHVAGFHSMPLEEINRRTITYYNRYTDSKVKQYGLMVKPTLFANFIERVAVEGYYNPFTGEGQANGTLPGFLLPFVVSHEMAHQAGIAAEDDANLMAYALGTMADDTSFKYSCYLDIWVYVNTRLHHRDSALAEKYEARLNSLTAAHLDTLEQISRKYQNDVANYTNEMYDSYLKLQNQSQGIKSYGNVTTGAWQLEVKRQAKGKELIRIP
jgi:hypothetical protein